MLYIVAFQNLEVDLDKMALQQDYLEMGWDLESHLHCLVDLQHYYKVQNLDLHLDLLSSECMARLPNMVVAPSMRQESLGPPVWWLPVVYSNDYSL